MHSLSFPLQAEGRILSRPYSGKISPHKAFVILRAAPRQSVWIKLSSLSVPISWAENSLCGLMHPPDQKSNFF